MCEVAGFSPHTSSWYEGYGQVPAAQTPTITVTMTAEESREIRKLLRTARIFAWKMLDAEQAPDLDAQKEARASAVAHEFVTQEIGQ